MLLGQEVHASVATSVCSGFTNDPHVHSFIGKRRAWFHALACNTSLSPLVLTLSQLTERGEVKDTRNNRRVREISVCDSCSVVLDKRRQVKSLHNLT